MRSGARNRLTRTKQRLREVRCRAPILSWVRSKTEYTLPSPQKTRKFGQVAQRPAECPESILPSNVGAIRQNTSQPAMHAAKHVIDMGNGSDLTWDNVVMDSPTLGYVDAMHQTLRKPRGTHSVHVLLGALGWHAFRKSCSPPPERLELLEGSDPARPGAGTSRYPSMRGAN